MAQLCSTGAQPLPPISCAPVPCPLHPERYLWILTAIVSDCGSGGLVMEFGFIHHDAPPVENHKSYLSLQWRWFPLLFKRNRLEPQSRTNCTLGSHHWYKEAIGWQWKYRRAELEKKERWHYDQVFYSTGNISVLSLQQKFHWHYLIQRKRCQDATLKTWDSFKCTKIYTGGSNTKSRHPLLHLAFISNPSSR